MNNYHVSVNITLKKGILDVQGKTVEQALHSIGFPMITDVRIGKYVELKISAASEDDAKSLLSDACRKLIANPIIEDFSLSLNLMKDGL